MSSLPWFRFYTDFLTNGRVRLLSFDDRCHYVELLCLKAMGGLDEFSDDAEMQLMRVARALELSPTHADECRHRLMRVGLIDSDWEPCGWDDRQFRSDSSKERVRKHREKQKKQQHNGMKRPCNVTVTAQDTDTDTDTELKARSSAMTGFDRFWSVYPKKVKKKTAVGIWKRKKLAGIADTLIDDVRERQARDGRWLDGFIPDPTTYLNGERWNDELAPVKSGSSDPYFAEIRRAVANAND